MILAVAWAVYLVPKAVKHHDEIARTRSVDRFSTAMRVLARREPVDPRNARLVVTPPRPTDRVLIPSRPAAESEESARPAVRPSRSDVAARRAAARAAAQRRRRTTLVLLAADLVVGALAAFAVTPWWSVAIPLTFTVLFLVLCRRQARRETDVLWAGSDPVEAAAPPRRAVRVDAAYAGSSDAALADRTPDLEADLDTAQVQPVDVEPVRVSVQTSDGGSLWDPLPVTLPTYVNKARAARTVRTIDLGAPGTWSSGRDDADSALVEETTPAPEPVEHEHRRAVGS